MSKYYIVHRGGKEKELGSVHLIVIDHSKPPPDPGFVREITPNASLKVRNHSPTGFEFGYGGSGPAQLALAILLDHMGEEPHPVVYQAFKFFAIAPMKHPGGFIAGSDIDEWLKGFKASEGGLPNES